MLAESDALPLPGRSGRSGSDQPILLIVGSVGVGPTYLADWKVNSPGIFVLNALRSEICATHAYLSARSQTLGFGNNTFF